MATFHFPDRTADPTGFTITGLESPPSSRKVVPQQAIRYTAGGSIQVDDLGNAIQFIELSIKLLSSADRNTLYDFFTATTNFANNSFDFTDDLGVDFDGCHLINPDLDFLRVTNNPAAQFSELLQFRVDP